jgi:hypothetical protein
MQNVPSGSAYEPPQVIDSLEALEVLGDASGENTLVCGQGSSCVVIST